MGDILKYEFRHLDVSTAPGYDPVYHEQFDIANPQSADFVFEADDTTNAIKRSNSATIVCFGHTGLYVKNWLIDNQYASVNSILCKITDVQCGTSRGEWIIKADGMIWCDNGPCAFQCTMVQYTPTTTCLQNTLIFDNHRGWFPEDGFIVGDDPFTGLPNDNYMHPRFRYCDDIKPQWVQNFLFVIAQGILIAFNTIVGSIFLMVQVIDFVYHMLTGNHWGLANDMQNAIDDVYNKVFGAFLGCNRLHPSPFVRNYFINACSKCGIEFESSILNDVDSNYYNSCHLFAPVKKGVLFDSTKDYIFDNRPVFNVITYAESLRLIFNAKYRLINGKFRFERKDKIDPDYVFDFTGADKNLILGGICWGWNGKLKPAYQTFHYEQDKFDTDGNLAGHRFNGVNDWNVTNNPLLDGEDAILINNWSTSRHTTDGIEERLIFTVSTLIARNTKAHLAHLLLMDSDITSCGKLLVWNTDSDKHTGAEAVRVTYNDWVTNTGLVYGDDYVASHPDDYWIYNYNYFYAPQANGYKQNISDFHSIDNPNSFNIVNKQWTINLLWCCDVIDKLIVFNPLDDEITAKADFKIKLTNTVDGIIRRVEVNYSNQTIIITGNIK